MAAVLGTVDAIVFTGGVGENCAPLREKVVAQIEFLRNAQVLVIHAEEEWEIVRECHSLARSTAPYGRGSVEVQTGDIGYISNRRHG
jgi:acetate kinase